MPVVQSTYSDTIPARFNGALRSTEPNVLISRTVEDAALTFGKSVTQGTEDKGVHPTTTGDTTAVGISVFDRGVDPATPDTYSVGDTARIIRFGVVTVTAGANVAAGETVYVVPATGAFTNVSTSNIAFAQGARFETTASSSALVDVRLG